MKRKGTVMVRLDRGGSPQITAAQRSAGALTALVRFGGVAVAVGALAAACGQGPTGSEGAGGGGGAGRGAVGEGKQGLTSAQVCLNGATRLYRPGAAGVVYDAQIAPSTPPKAYGASNTFNTGVTKGVERRTLLQFDLSAIPSGLDTNIQGADLYLTEGNVLPTAQRALQIHRVTSPAWTLAPYGESGATGITWESFAANGSFDPTPASFINNSTTPASKLLQGSITQLVADWVHGVNPNYGILLMDPGGPITNFWSSEYTGIWSRPYLQVCYTITCHPGWADCNANGLDGCEADLAASATSCGGCGNVCTVQNGVPACVNSACQVASCNLGFGDCNGTYADGCETLITTNADCGGCGVPCARPNGQASCATGTCTLVACNPGFFDCDGDQANGCEALPCAVSQQCLSGADCVSGVCVNGTCAQPTCTDTVKNGGETGVDCGGTTCPKCGSGQPCLASTDCQSGACVNKACASVSCSDGLENGLETDVDCGGTTCSPCVPGQSCSLGSDCNSGVCTAGVCQGPSCNDGVLNGAESAIDCGGGTCPKCSSGKACNAGDDCIDGVCTGDVCQMCNCHDNVKNCQETGVDCGGTSCQPCGVGQPCNSDTDCDAAAGQCVGGVCQATCGHGIVDGGGTTTCGVGACQVTITSCAGGVPQTCTPGQPATELCDGIDNDCNGIVDDDNTCGGCKDGATQSCYTGAPGTLDMGLCHAGIQTCAHGSWGNCLGEVTPTAELCDSLDNNCDGQVDEDLGQTTCGMGACAVTTVNCLNGLPQTCTPRPPSQEICDGIDDDCDGILDNPLDLECGTGACQNTAPACVNGQDNTCVPLSPSEEICDGLDNDCDGQVDEGNPSGGASCWTGKSGICGAGTTSCAGGTLICNQTNQPQSESCDGIDDDCDGLVDDGDPGGGMACATGELGICAVGTTVCAAGVVSCLQAAQPVNETCNGLDDDCDGVVDNGDPGGGGACDTGLDGLCAAGTRSCTGGGLVCNQNVQPSPDSPACDGLDHDCDGVANTGCGCQDGATFPCYTGAPATRSTGACHDGVQTCAGAVWGACVGQALPTAEACDAVDNDCNGQVDDGLGDLTCGVGACANSAPACVNGQPQACVAGPPQTESCDGLDNDCDGVVDDGNPGAGMACNTGLLGVCQAGTSACVNGDLVCSQNVQAHAEVCNGLDDDCDGTVDNGDPGGGQGCITGKPGICGPGTTVCTSGHISCQQSWQPVGETCNGLDDNCNGQVDEGNPGGGAACATGKLGVCAAGTTMCSTGGVTCVQNVQAAPEQCDGLDHDCNGVVGNGCSCVGDSTQACYSGGSTTRNTGVCRDGTQACVAGVWGPCVGELLPSTELCDGFDNDCDGQVDDGFGTSSCGVGGCARTVGICVNGHVSSCVPGTPQSETCNGVDDDCDGQVDEGNPGGGAACDTGLPGACSSGTTTCTNGAATCLPQAPSIEICDGLDNDCDGFIDDGNPGGGAACTTGLIGACGAGVLTCTNGTFACVAPSPRGEVCDGLDNDCDGAVDGTAAVPAPWVANSGLYTVVANGGFEGNTGGWTGQNVSKGVFVSTNAQAAHGSYSAVAVTVVPLNGSLYALTRTVSVAPGQTYALSAFVFTFGATQGALYLDLNDVPFEPTYRSTRGVAALMNYPGWQFIHGTFTVPSNVTTVTIRVVRDGFGAAVMPGDAIFVDQVALTVASQLAAPTAQGATLECDTGLMGDCAIGVWGCDVTGPRCIQSNSPAIEVCEGYHDESCDGFIDEGCDCIEGTTIDCYTGPNGTMDVGTCAGGNRICHAGSFSACLGEVVPQAETCNGLDDDCNGVVDDDVLGGGDLCATGDIGACASGTVTCVAGQYVCHQDVQAHPETCNGVDDDCDGDVDDGDPGGGATCTVAGELGQCAVGRTICNGGALVCGPINVPVAEACDGLDDDCDGQSDEGDPGSGLPCFTSSYGICSTGKTTCAAGSIACVADLQPVAEVCDDGLDNDCDGMIDDGCPCVDGNTQPCYAAAAGTMNVGVCHAGLQTCAGGVWGGCVGQVTPAAEACDGQDNDCNGVVDDGLGTIKCGVGQCRSTVPACTGGAPTACVAGAPQTEVCDGLDDDCDGVIDDGDPGGGSACGTGKAGICAAGTTACSAGAVTCVQDVAPKLELCNGLDDNCNGAVDEGLGNITCGSGSCAGTVAACVAGVPSTCQPKPNGSACNDGDACTKTDVCQSGVCVGSNPVACSAPDQCHDVGTCNPVTGQCSNPAKANGSACTDQDLCTQTDTCQNGACVGAGKIVCPAAGPCETAGGCDPSTGLCTNATLPDGAGCDDGDACTANDACSGGVCSGVPKVCPAPDACHLAGSCDVTGQCVYANAANGTACNDGNACTTVDACQSGVCVGSSAIHCPVAGACEIGGGCDTNTGACMPVVAQPDGATCSDGDACTASDTCVAGVCQPGHAVVCPASTVACMVAAACDPVLGCQLAADVDGTACSDNNACTSGDTCQGGVCAGAAITCPVAGPCETGGGACDPVNGCAAVVPKADGTACDDGDPCTSPDTCQGGVCGAGTATGTPCVTGLPGVCAAGATACLGGGISCQPTAQPGAEVCGDGLDNDCDGQIDDGCACGSDGDTQPCYGSAPVTNGVGACHAGVQTCAGHVWGSCVGQVTPATETCDGLDNDCNAVADDGLGTILCGVGQCATSAAACANGQPGVCVAGAPHAEVCNGLDDDCDGAIDDGNPGGGAACITGVSGGCATGTTLCTAQGILCVQTALPSAEVCGDGLDNDCDGMVDDGCACNNGDTQACYTAAAATKGVGTCHAGLQTCANHVWGACGGQVTPAPETCNGLDDDCDGSVDDACTSVATCKTLHDTQPSLGSGAYTIDPDGAGGVAAFSVYCDMATDGGGWTLFMFVNAPNTSANTTLTVINPTTLNGYYYMSPTPFAALGSPGMRVRAWAIHNPNLYLECDYQSDGTSYKNWQANSSCVQQVGRISGGYATLSDSYGFVYGSYYDSINPANPLTNNSVFTKANTGNYSSGWAVPGWSADTRTSGNYKWYYGEWATQAQHAMIYAIR